MSEARDKLKKRGLDPVDLMAEVYHDIKDIEEMFKEAAEVIPTDLVKVKLDTAKTMMNTIQKEEEIEVKKLEASKGKRDGNKTYYIPTYEMETVNGKLVPKKVMQIEQQDG